MAPRRFYRSLTSGATPIVKLKVLYTPPDPLYLDLPPRLFSTKSRLCLPIIGLQVQQSPHTPSGQYSAPSFSSGGGECLRRNEAFSRQLVTTPLHVSTETNRRERFTRQSGRELRTLIQDQQTLLQQILNNQQLYQTRQSAMEERLSKLESSMSSVSSSKSSSSEGATKKKRVVTHSLSVSLYVLHIKVC